MYVVGNPAMNVISYAFRRKWLLVRVLWLAVYEHGKSLLRIRIQAHSTTSRNINVPVTELTVAISLHTSSGMRYNPPIPFTLASQWRIQGGV